MFTHNISKIKTGKKNKTIHIQSIQVNSSTFNLKNNFTKQSPEKISKMLGKSKTRRPNSTLYFDDSLAIQPQINNANPIKNRLDKK